MNQPNITVEDLQQALHSAIRDIRSGTEWRRWLDGAASFHSYSFRNVVLIQLQAPDASWVGGYRTWRRLGRQVAKKERGIRILAPLVRRKATSPDRADEAVDCSDRCAPREVGTVIGFRVASIWDITQTDGPPLSRSMLVAPNQTEASAGLWEALAREVYAAGFNLVERDLGDRAVAGHTGKTKTIVISNRLDDVAAVACLAREFAHLRMHRSEEIASPDGRVRRELREVEAESVAYTLLAHHGLANRDASFPDVAQWATRVNEDEPEKVVEATGTRVLVVARQLIEATDKHLKREGRKLLLGSVAPAVDLSAPRTDPRPDPTTPSIEM